MSGVGPNLPEASSDGRGCTESRAECVAGTYRGGMATGDGGGFVDCGCGNRHWGLFGAAGLLLTRPGSGEVFLQLRAPWVHTPNTWGTPGGARDSHESPVTAALREAHEENAIVAAGVQVMDVLRTVDHDDWSYDLVLGLLRAGEPALVSHESTAAGWFSPEAVPALDLHPGLARSWPRARTLLDRILRGVPA